MKIGILGLGSIGKRHAKNLIGLGHEVIGYDPAGLHFDVRKEDSVTGVRQEDRDYVLCNSDAFVIASPTTEHWQDLIDTGIANKPTFAEKPLSSRLRSIDESYPHVKMVGYNLRFHHVVRKVKEWLDLMGLPVWARFECAQLNNKPIYLRDGVILNWSHEIDLALYLLGHGRCTSASCNETESLADINILHVNGCRTSVHLDYLTDPEERGFEIFCTKGKIWGRLAPSRYCGLHLNQNDGTQCDYYFSAQDSYDENYVDEMKAFIDRINGKETIGATCQDGKDVLEICLDAKMGHWQG